MYQGSNLSRISGVLLYSHKMYQGSNLSRISGVLIKCTKAAMLWDQHWVTNILELAHCINKVAKYLVTTIM